MRKLYLKSLIRAIGQMILICFTLFSAAQAAAGCPDSYTTWMSDNASTLGNKTLTQLSLPGSHDAGMWEVHDCTLAKIGGPTACNTQTQHLQIDAQLGCGLRYFDLRPVYTNQKFYTGHFGDVPGLGISGCLGGDLQTILNNVNTFAKANPRELIILKFSHYYDRDGNKWGFSPEIMSNLQNAVKTTLTTRFSNATAVPIISTDLTTLLTYGNVISVFDSVTTSWNDGILSLAELNTYDEYSKTPEFATMKSDQFEKLANNGGNPNKLFLLSWTLTQNPTQAAGCSFDPTGITSSIRDLAVTANKHLDEIQPEEASTGKLGNIIYTDYVDGLSTQVATLSSGITADIGNVTCSSNEECSNNTCARWQAGGDDLVCCPGGKSGVYAGYSYCHDMPDGKLCWSDAMCSSGYCKGNNSGFTKGTCTALKPAGASCETNSDCSNNTCARPEAGTDSLICCPGGKSGVYAGYSYCYDMNKGSKCWSDAMCASDNCSGNWSGMRKGTCE